MHQHSNYWGLRRREKEDVWENFQRDYSWRFSQHGKGNRPLRPRGTKSPYRINPRGNTPRHILIKLTKTKHKERILKATREKQQATYKKNPIQFFFSHFFFVVNKKNPIHLTTDLSAETLQARRKWQDVFKLLKGKSLQKKLPSKDLIITDWEIKSFADKYKLSEFITIKPALQQMSRNTREGNDLQNQTPNN